MKTRTVLIGVAMAAALNCGAVNAQVLGAGSLGGGLGGTLSGGLRDMNVMTNGAANGSLSGDLDTGTLRRTTRDTAARTTGRVRDTTSNVRDRAAAKVDRTKEVASTSASSTAGAAKNAVDGMQLDGAADVAGSATSSVSRDGVNLAGDAQGTASGTAVSKPELLSQVPGQDRVNGDALSKPLSQASDEVADKTALTQSPAKTTEGAAPPKSELLNRASSQAADKTPALPSASQTVGEPAKAADSKPMLNLSGDANGSATASRDGVTADGGGSAKAARK